jgi:hypothetical protein
LTYAFAFTNLAHVIVDSVGNYERDRAITEAERQAKEEKVNVAVDFLCRASGIFTFLSDNVLPEWETSRVSPPNSHKPPDLTREVSNSLAKFVASFFDDERAELLPVVSSGWHWLMLRLWLFEDSCQNRAMTATLPQVLHYLPHIDHRPCWQSCISNVPHFIRLLEHLL